ncbi:MAG: hypothetical protein PHH49_05760 [Candidatus Omnitrophica bacterium]|nr:hypothetical protein [Candidatus Omnitrophota bacterium]MDD5488449.1 hypothetical protein [Candidatus Omnitrophota bacterium]
MRRILFSLVFLCIVAVWESPGYAQEEELLNGLNPEQPIPVGGIIYRSVFYAKGKDPSTGKTMELEFFVYYKGVKDNNIVVEAHDAGKVFTFERPLNDDKKTLLNLTTTRTYSVEVVDVKDRIVVEETDGYIRDIPIRVYPDLKQMVISKSDDFQDTMGILSAVEERFGMEKSDKKGAQEK